MTLQGSLDVDRFNKFMADFLQENSANLFRSKGVLSFVGLDAKFVFQVQLAARHVCSCELRLEPYSRSTSGIDSRHVRPYGEYTEREDKLVPCS